MHRASSYVWEEDREQLDAHPEVFGVDPRALEDGDVRAAARDDGTVVGFATVRPARGGACVLEDLFVEPSAMRHGIGRALIEDAVARAAAAGHAELSVVAAERTRGFYEKLGFVVRGAASTQFGPALRLSREILTPMDDPVTQIAELLHEAGETHHTVFRITDGDDPDWASWYADWLIRLSELPRILGATPVRSELVWLLVQLDKDYGTSGAETPWPQWYAERVVEHFKQA